MAMTRFYCLMLAIALTAPLGGAGCGKQDAPKPVAVAPSKDHGAEPAKLPPLPVATPLDAKKPDVPKVVVVARKDRAKPTETMTLTAEAFGGEIRKSADDAARKFENVYVELTGVVRAVGSRDKEGFVTLDAGAESLGIVCFLGSEKEPWAKISRGQKIKLRGQWPDIWVQPSLEACELVDLGTNPAQELKAEALADEFAKGKDAARAKYQEKPLIVTGIVVHAAKNELGAVRLFLKGAGDTRVDCGFNAIDQAEAGTQMIGATVRLTGEFSAFESTEAPALRGCRVITEKK